MAPYFTLYNSSSKLTSTLPNPCVTTLTDSDRWYPKIRLITLFQHTFSSLICFYWTVRAGEAYNNTDRLCASCKVNRTSSSDCVVVVRKNRVTGRIKRSFDWINIKLPYTKWMPQYLTCSHHAITTQKHGRYLSLTFFPTTIQGAANKSNPLPCFVNISTTNLNFYKKINVAISRSYLHIIAKLCCIITTFD